MARSIRYTRPDSASTRNSPLTPNLSSFPVDQGVPGKRDARKAAGLEANLRKSGGFAGFVLPPNFKDLGEEMQATRCGDC